MILRIYLFFLLEYSGENSVSHIDLVVHFRKKILLLEKKYYFNTLSSAWKDLRHHFLV